MSRFLRRRARALVDEAERLGSYSSHDDSRQGAVERLYVARELLDSCQDHPLGLPPLLRRIGELSADWGDEELSDRSFLTARRLEKEIAELEKRLRADSGLPRDAGWGRLDTAGWSAMARARAEALRSGIHPPWHHLVVQGGCAGRLVAALGSEWVSRGISVSFQGGRLLAETLLRAHRDLDTASVLRRFDAYSVVIVSEPELEEQDSLRCLDLFVEDRSSRGSLVISGVSLQELPGPESGKEPATLGKSRWLSLLLAGGDTLMLELE